MLPEPSRPRRLLAIAGLFVAVGLLVPGLILPVITIRGVLQPDGVAELAPKLIEQGISDESLAQLKPMINPMMLALIEASPGGLRGALVGRLGPQIAEGLRKGGNIEIYQQTRSILGSVRHLYEVGSATAATLILLFSVIVPFAKILLVLWAASRTDAIGRERTLHFVEIIAKWSMADVFAVALFIAYLAAQATQSAPGTANASVLAFTATFGAGFYWFAAYCVFSLALQQATARWILKTRSQ
jgi:paraquat-inducible protein A